MRHRSHRRLRNHAALLSGTFQQTIRFYKEVIGMTKEQMIEDFELIELEEVEDLSVPLHGNNSNVGTD